MFESPPIDEPVFMSIVDVSYNALTVAVSSSVALRSLQTKCLPLRASNSKIMSLSSDVKII